MQNIIDLNHSIMRARRTTMRIKRYCLSVWAFFDPLYFLFTRLQYIQKKCGDKTVMRVRLTRYKGKALILADGTMINKDDTLVKIHLHNIRMLREVQGYESDVRRALMIYKSVRESLPAIAMYIRKHPNSAEVKGIIGITMLYKGCKKLGFEQYSIGNPFYQKFKQIAHLPIYYLSSVKGSRKEMNSPMYLFMSKDTLFNQYGHD